MPQPAKKFAFPALGCAKPPPGEVWVKDAAGGNLRTGGGGGGDAATNSPLLGESPVRVDDAAGDKASARQLAAWRGKVDQRAAWEKDLAAAKRALVTASAGSAGAGAGPGAGAAGPAGFGALAVRWLPGLLLALPAVGGATLALFLPAFFLLLLVRSNTVLRIAPFIQSKYYRS